MEVGPIRYLREIKFLFTVVPLYTSFDQVLPHHPGYTGYGYITVDAFWLRIQDERVFLNTSFDVQKDDTFVQVKISRAHLVYGPDGCPSRSAAILDMLNKTTPEVIDTTLDYFPSFPVRINKIKSSSPIFGRCPPTIRKVSDELDDASNGPSAKRLKEFA